MPVSSLNTENEPPPAPARRAGRFVPVVRGRPSWRQVMAALGLALALAFYLVNAAHFAQMPLRIEENEWPQMAEAIYETGRPVLDWRESHRVRTDEMGRLDRADWYGVWHPPFYQYTLAASMVVLGTDASYTLRLVGVASLLLTCLLLFMIARLVTPERWLPVGAVASGLLLIHPYAIQGSTFIDIDTGVYAPITLFCLWLVLRATESPARSKKMLIAVAAGVTLVFWTKVTTALVLVPVIGLYWLLRVGPRSFAREALPALALGAAAFLGTYALWCEITGIPFSFMWNVTFAEKSGRLAPLEDPVLLEQAARWHLYWFVPALVIVAAVYAADAVRALVRDRRVRPMDLIFGFATAILLLYVVVSPTDGYYQGKYAFPALPALILATTWLLLRRGTGRLALVAALIVGLVAVLVTALMPDLTTNLLTEPPTRYTTAVILAASAAALWIARWMPGARLPLAAGPVVVLAALFVGQSIRSFDADTSPMYPVQDTADFQWGARTINGFTGPDDLVVASKDIGFYVDPKVLELQGLLYRADGDRLTAQALKRLRTIKAVATTSFVAGLPPATASVVAQCFPETMQRGSVQVFIRGNSC